MLRPMALVLFLAGMGACAEPMPPIDPVVSCEIGVTLDESAPEIELDLIIVVSDAPSMAAYRDTLIASLDELGQSLDTLTGQASLRVAVVDASGALTTEPQIADCAPPAGAWLEDLDLPWFFCPAPATSCRDRNHDGERGETIACMGALPADGTAPAPLLQRLDRALATGAGTDFTRPDAYTMVLLIGPEDDASPLEVVTYATRLHALRPDRDDDVFVSVITGAATPRLDALRARFPERATVTAIDGAWSTALDALQRWDDLLGPSCLEAPPPDLDAQQPGLQADCVATELDGTPIPRCLMASDQRPDPATPLPCYWIREPDPIYPDCGHMPVVEREATASLAWMQCLCELEPVDAP